MHFHPVRRAFMRLHVCTQPNSRQLSSLSRPRRTFSMPASAGLSYLCVILICYAQRVTKLNVYRPQPTPSLACFRSSFGKRSVTMFSRYSNLRILTTALRSSTLAKPAGPSFLASSLVGQRLLCPKSTPSTQIGLGSLGIMPAYRNMTYTCSVGINGACPCLAFTP